MLLKVIFYDPFSVVKLVQVFYNYFLNKGRRYINRHKLDV